MDNLFDNNPASSAPAEHLTVDIPSMFCDNRNMPVLGRYDWQSPVAQAYANYGAGVARIHAGTVDGTGFFVNSDGLMVTDLHVVNKRISRDAGVIVTTADGVVHAARVINEDPAHDLALLQVTPTWHGETFKALRLAKSSALRMHEHLVGLGFPDEAKLLHVSPGIYNTTKTLNQFSINGGYLPGEESSRRVVTADMAVHKGNSGGPVINDRGEVVAIIDMGKEKGQALTLSTPVEDLLALLNRTQKITGCSYFVPPGSSAAPMFEQSIPNLDHLLQALKQSRTDQLQVTRPLPFTPVYSNPIGVFSDLANLPTVPLTFVSPGSFTTPRFEPGIANLDHLLQALNASKSDQLQIKKPFTPAPNIRNRIRLLSDLANLPTVP